MSDAVFFARRTGSTRFSGYGGSCPPEWRGPVIGPDIEGWDSITENGDRRIDLTGLPDPFPAELAWMAHWQAADGTRCSVLAMNQLANILHRAIREGHPFPASMLVMDWETGAALQGWFYATRWGRLTPQGSRARLRVIFRFARLALLARCSDGPWWSLDDWHPRCDLRIPLSRHEPQAHYGCSPGQITRPWLRDAVKWHLGTMLESGALRWSTVSQERLPCLLRFDRWLTAAFRDARDVLGEPAAAARQAAAFRRWDADPASRSGGNRQRAEVVHPRLINDDLGPSPSCSLSSRRTRPRPAPSSGRRRGIELTQAHADSWFRQVTRIPHRPALTDRYYVDDHALAQIPAALPLLGLPRGQQMPITRGDGTQMLAGGLDDPQAMRMILLQILTGRRASEIRTCDFDCLSPVPGSPVAADGQQIARFSYAQSKIDIAPDSILVDREVIAVIEEQQDWVRAKLPGITPRYLFLRRTGNNRGDKPYTSGTYNWMLREFSDIAQITDSKGTAGPAQPHPPVPAHQADPSRRARPAGPRSAALCRARQPDHVHALHRTPRGTRRAGVPGHRQAQGRRHPDRDLPRGPRHPAPVRPRRPASPARLVPAAAAADLRQGQRLPDLLGLRHRRHPSSRR